MWITFLTALNQMVTVLCLLALGYLLNRLKLLGKETEVVLSKLVTMVFLPALSAYTFMTECTVENLKTHGLWVLCGAAFALLSMLLGMALAGPLAHGDPYLSGIYRYALTFPNTGGVGTALVLAFFGTSGLFTYQLFLLANGTLTYTWGVMQLVPRPGPRRPGLRVMLGSLVNPVFMATFIGAFFGLTGLTGYLPGIIPKTLQSVGGCYSVVVLLLTGFVIGNYSIRDILGDRSVYLFTGLRLAVIPCLFLVVLRLLKAPDLLCALTCLTYACPCGMNTVVYPAAYGKDSRPGASMILISSVLSVLTVPAIYALL